MLLRHIENVEERTDHVLQRVRDGVRRRDALLGDIRHAVHAEGELHAALQEIGHVQYRLMPQYVHRSAGLARTVAANASLAERSSKRVRRLDALLQRVQDTRAIVDAMKAMEGDVAQVSTVLESGDIEKTVQLLHSYEAAQRVLTSASPGAAAAQVKPGGDAEPAAADADGGGAGAASGALMSDVMRNAREKVRARLLSMMEEAVQVNDKLTSMKLTRLLAELGDTAMASRLYGDWIANHTIAALAKLIDAEMKKMDDPAKVAMSHLALVSQCLDTVAAAFESDEEFTREAFGSQGPLTLLAELHSRATARCVPVLSDFIERRKGALAQLEKHAAASSSSSPASAMAGGGGGAGPGSEGRSTSAGASRAASPPPASQANANANAVVASARRADQILEEISHMVSCGHIYLSFVERKQSEYEKRLKAAAAAAASSVDGTRGDASAADAAPASSAAAAAAAAAAGSGSGADSLWRTRDNALLNSMQDILAFYVPLQNAYFTIAYDQAIDLQLHAIRDAAKEAAAAAARAGTGGRGAGGAGAKGGVGAGAGAGAGGVHGGGPVAANAGSATAFMSGLQNLYSVATSSADELISAVGVGAGGAGGTNASSSSAAAAEAAELASFWFFTHNGRVTLPDDVFFVLRMALHRATNTKSAQICSAVVMSAMDVVQSRLLPEIESHTAIAAAARSGGGGGGGGGATGNTGTRRRPAQHGGFLTPDELHWTGAAQQCATYLQRMADELQQLNEATFAANPRDVTRFRELASNMRVLGKALQDKQIPAWLEAFAEVCCDSVLPPHMERFAAISYDMKEEVYYHYELNDVWVQACLMDLGAGLQYLHQHLADPKLFDVLLAAMARRTAKATSGVLLRKRFSLFGALQVDKDVRALRGFFVERALNDLTPIREAFSALSLMATLLLSDKPADALEEAANTALTSEEKKKVLLTRVEFRKETVTALPL